MFVFNCNRALAAILASVSVFGFVGSATAAFAQEEPNRNARPSRVKKDDKPVRQEASKKDYSKAFVAAYGPFSKQINDGAVDVATLKAGLPAVEASASTPDDKFALGQAIYSIGTKAKDLAMERRGVNMMLDSGAVEADKIGVYSFLAGQLAYQAEDWADARKRVGEAVAAGYTENDPQVVIAESYFNEDNYAAGLDVLDKAIAAKVAAGQTVPDNWIKRGLAMAYEGNLAPQSTKFARMYVESYPSSDAWGDAIAIQRTFFEADGQDTLDLMRLAQRTNSLRNERDYVDYINAADARRLPGEVARVIDAGLAAGKLRANDVFVSESRSIANGRIAADRADLPGLERDARAASASALTASAAGDAFLSYEQPAKAEEFYTIALGKPGVDKSRVLTRLGIAQVDQGKFAEAQATFAKVDGSRKEIATLWSIYAKQQAK
jgi:hypothetical protein